MRKSIKIKEWFYDKQQATAGRYNCYIDKRDSEEGYVEVSAEQLKESEKAIQVRLETGSVVGSFKGWTCWIPKSVIA